VPLMMLRVTALMAITGLTAFQTVGAHYARDVLLNANLFIWITLVNTGVIFLVAL
jgi:glucuronide carrier protein